MIAKYLAQAGFIAEPLTGSFKQRDRERVMDRIKGGDLRYMVATDIASRGIDISNLSHVFNYSLPEFPEVYLHRVGRTGRIGKLGVALSMVDGKGLGTSDPT
ncbi:MAG: C-terminal helicase domain-containing protein [Myxococcota bacterium]